MKQSNINKYKYLGFFGIITTLLLIYFNCNTNPFFGVGTTPNTKDPSITISSHNDNDIVTGTVTISGTCKAEISVSTVYLQDENGNNIAQASVSGVDWSVTFNSTSYPDGQKLFKIQVTDSNNKTVLTSLILKIHNYGPQVTSLYTDNTFGVYYNPFTLSISLKTVYPATKIRWEIQSVIDPLADISADVVKDKNNQNISDILTGLINIYIDPSALSGKGSSNFKTGVCILSITAWDTTGFQSQTSGTLTLTFDFNNKIPQISISQPDATSDTLAKTFGSDYTVTGTAQDDIGIKEVYVWYKKSTQSDSEATVDTVVIAGSPKITTFTHTLSGLTSGTYLVKSMARDTDSPENTSDYTALHYFKVDTAFPIISITSPVAGSWQKGIINILANIHLSAGQIANVEDSTNDGATYFPDTSDVVPTSSYNLNYSFNTASINPSGGETKFYIKATNSGGNQTITPISFYVDNEPPTGTIQSPPASNSGLNRTILIRGIANDLVGPVNAGIVDSVTLRIHGYSDITPSGIGSWSYYFDSTAISIGDVTFDVIIKDMANNITTLSRTMHIDQSAAIPHITVTNLTAGMKIFGIYNITGEASDDDGVANIKVQIDNDTSADATGTTSWTYKLDTTLYPQGAHQFKYIVTDIDGIKSSCGVINFTIDPDLPQIIYTSVADNDAIKSNPTISGRVQKSLGTITSIEIKLQGTSYTQDWTTSGLTLHSMNTNDASFDYTVNTTTYGEGPLTITIRAKDDSDKVNTQAINLVIDTQRPSGSISTPAANSIFTTSLLSLAGNCSDPVPSSGLPSSNVLIDFLNKGTSEVTHVVDGATYVISGAVSSWTYNWTIPANQKDGLYKIILYVTDRAGNTPSSSVEIDNIRLARYTPTLSNLYINGIPVTNNMFVVQNCNFTGTITDNNVNDIVAGVQKIELYLSTDNAIDTGDGSPFAQSTYAGTNTSETFSLNYTFSTAKQYLIYRAIDKSGGYRDYPYIITLDYIPPTQQFKFTSRDYYPSTQSSNPGYSAIYWIKLDATDDNDLSGATIQTKLGTTSGDENLIGLNTYTISDYMKIDLHNIVTDPIYLWYKLADKAGNQTTAVLNLSRDSSLPTITCASLTGGYINKAGLNISGTSTGGGATVQTVKFSATDGDITAGYSAAGTTSWTYSIPQPTVGDHTIIGLVTANDSTNWYQNFSFTYDDVSPDSTFTVSETSNGKLSGNNISGVVRFSGVYTDNYDDRYSKTDFRLRINIDGVLLDVSDDNKTKNADGSFNWYYDWNSQTHSSYNVVKNNIQIYLTSYDKAGNYKITTMTNKNIVPYITSITPVSGKIVPVIGYDGSSWTNLNDNKTYTYRLGSGSITINGYNLDSSANEILYYNTTEASIGSPTNYWTIDTEHNMNAITFNLSTIETGTTPTSTNYIYLKVAGTNTIDSNDKKIIYFNNYSNTDTGYIGIAETDMVLDDSNNAKVIVQKHEGTGSGIHRFWETAENTFTPAYNQANYIYHGYNRFWFINIIKDRGTPDAGQIDTKYYLFNCDSENRDTAAKGLQLTGRYDGWATLATTYTMYDANIQLPVNDWDPDSTYETERNRWRMGAANGQTGDPGTTNSFVDWNVPWGDMVAKDNLVYTTWYSDYDNKLHYRKLDNSSSSVITPTITNPGFETGDTTGWTKFSGTGTLSVNGSNIHNGSYNAQLTGDGSLGEVDNTVSGLSANSNYTLTAWFKASGNINTAILGVKGAGVSGSPKTTTVTANTTYQQVTVSFTTTATTTVTIYFSQQHASRTLYVDDFAITPVPVGASKSPAGTVNTDSSITFNVKGKFPAITLDNSGYPVIVCYDETNGKLVSYFATSATPLTTSDWNSYDVDTSGNVGTYPDIEIQGSNIHIVYQDLTNSSLKYVYSATPAGLPAATKITIDADDAPGYYNDIRITPTNQPVVTYITYAYLGTGNAIKAMRFTGTAGVDSFTDRTKWERLTLPCAHNISENKVRGYYVDAATDWLFGFGKSDRPEFFREKP